MNFFSLSPGPFDVISQHLMLYNKGVRTKKLSSTAAPVENSFHLNINPDIVKRNELTKTVIRELYRCDGGLRVKLSFLLV